MPLKDKIFLLFSYLYICLPIYNPTICKIYIFNVGEIRLNGIRHCYMSLN